MINIARAKGLKITAEGVETNEQRDILMSMGCHYLQGFLLSRPLSPDAARTLLSAPDSTSTLRGHTDFCPERHRHTGNPDQLALLAASVGVVARPRRSSLSLRTGEDYSPITCSLSRLRISMQRVFFRRTIPFSRSLDMLRDTVSTVIPR